MQNFMSDITGITVCSNTRSLLQEAYESVRRFHPDMQIIIIDGSDPADDCYSYVKSLASNITTVGICDYNIGHGRGMDAGIRMCNTRFALIFDSDIVMLKSPVEAMLAMMEEDTYGVGYTEPTGEDGFEYGAHAHHKGETITRYLHPYFQLIQVSEYFKFPPYVHHGAPCYQTMNAIKRAGLSDIILKEFPGLGHSSSAGWNWTGTPREFIRHDTRGTRDVRTKKGLLEIERNWDYEYKDSDTGPRPLFKKL
jgi:GT2 family glycosyltransferase